MFTADGSNLEVSKPNPVYKRDRKPDRRIKFELAVVIALVFIVWGLLSLPLVFYHITEDQVCINLSDHLVTNHFELCESL